MYLNELLLRLLARDDPYARCSTMPVVRAGAAWRAPQAGPRLPWSPCCAPSSCCCASWACCPRWTGNPPQPLQPEARYALVAESGLQATTSPRGSLQGRSGWR
jgi:hypothetical protein